MLSNFGGSGATVQCANISGGAAVRVKRAENGLKSNVILLLPATQLLDWLAKGNSMWNLQSSIRRRRLARTLTRTHTYLVRDTFAVWQRTGSNSFNNFQCLSIVHNLNVHANMFLCVCNVHTQTHSHAQLCSKLSFLLPLGLLLSPPCCTLFYSIYLVLHFTHWKQKERRDEKAKELLCLRISRTHTHTHGHTHACADIRLVRYKF